MGFNGVYNGFMGLYSDFKRYEWDVPSGNDQQVASWKIAHGNSSCSELKDGGSFHFAMSNIYQKVILILSQ